MRLRSGRREVTGSGPASVHFFTLAVLSLTLLCFLWQGAGQARAEGPDLNARSWILVDASDGAVLTGSKSDLRLPVASATKLMTAYVAIRRLPLSRRVVVPAYPADPVESVMGLEEGQRVSVRDLLYGLILSSGNDAAVALAEAVSGNTRSFVREMNRTARRLGLKDTRFTNPIGLDDTGHFSTASDLARLARRLLRIDSFSKISDAREAELTSFRPPRRITTRNDFLFARPWATGVKTGRTLGAGYVLVSSASRNGVSLIGTVIGAPTESARDAETIRLMRYGFGLFERRRVASRGEVVGSVPLRFGDGELPLVAARDLVVPLRRGQDLRTDVRTESEEVEGPVGRGRKVGELLALVNGERRGSVSLRAAEDVPAPSTLDRVRDLTDGLNPYLLAGVALLILGAAIAIRIRSARVRKSVRRAGRRTR